MDTTFDAILNKRVWLEQPAEGYRISVDTVLLAAAVPAQPGQKVLDMGCGVGGAMFCLAARVPGLYLVGVDIQEELTALCRRNADHNKHPVSVEILTGDAAALIQEGFDHVLMNPPFHEEERHSLSDNKMKRTANAGKAGDLPLWIASAAKALKPSGILTIIHRADRQDEIIGEAAKHFGKVEILPIISKANAAPKRIILRMHKGSPHQVTLCQGFMLYGSDGRYCDAAESVLRHAEPLEFLPVT